MPPRNPLDDLYLPDPPDPTADLDLSGLGASGPPPEMLEGMGEMGEDPTAGMGGLLDDGMGMDEEIPYDEESANDEMDGEPDGDPDDPLATLFPTPAVPGGGFKRTLEAGPLNQYMTQRKRFGGM